MSLTDDRTANPIDVDEVLEDLQAVVAEKGDGYVYKAPGDGACVYVYDGQPSCIVGNVLNRRGLLSGVADYNELPTYALPVLEFLQAHFTPAAIQLLSRAQRSQDTCVETWGDALIAAKEAAAEVQS